MCSLLCDKPWQRAFPVLCMCAEWLEHHVQATDAAAATASKSLLESLHDSDDDFGGPAPLLSAASAALPPLQLDGHPDTLASQVQLMAAEAPCTTACGRCLAEAGLEAQPTCSITSEQLDRQMRDSSTRLAA